LAQGSRTGPTGFDRRRQAAPVLRGAAAFGAAPAASGARRASKFFDRSLAERRQIIGTAARHQPLVDDDFPIDPLGPGVFEVGRQRWP
jgi:hypothetical protein